MILKIEFLPIAKEQFDYWKRTNAKVAAKILVMLENMIATPFQGLGKPELLKHNRSGEWSRRIDKKNRLTYKVEGNVILITSCREHY